MDTNLIIQYTFVGLCLLAIIVWTIRKLIKIHKSGFSNPCCGCSLGDSCGRSAETTRKQKAEKTCCSSHDSER